MKLVSALGKTLFYFAGCFIAFTYELLFVKYVSCGFNDFIMNQNWGTALSFSIPAVLSLVGIGAAFPFFASFARSKISKTQPQLEKFWRSKWCIAVWLIGSLFVSFLPFLMETYRLLIADTIYVIILWAEISLLISWNVYPFFLFWGKSFKWHFLWIIPFLICTGSTTIIILAAENPLAVKGCVITICLLAGSALIYIPLQKFYQRICRLAYARGGLLILAAAGILLLNQAPDSSLFALKEAAPRQEKDGTYLLGTRKAFEWFILETDAGNKNINARMTRNIVLNDTENWENWEEYPPENAYFCVSYYNGTFDGNGYALDGYYSGNKSPVFSTLEKDGCIKNLTVRNSFFQTSLEDSIYETDSGEQQLVRGAALCINNSGKIENCHIEAHIKAAGEAAGIVSFNSEHGTIKNCSFTGSVTGGLEQNQESGEIEWENNIWESAGICRLNNGTIQDCINKGDVRSMVHQDGWWHNILVGGITAQNYGTVEKCVNQGNIISTQIAGGITASSSGTLDHCENHGNVTVEPLESQYSGLFYAAGINGCNSGKTISCYNTGQVNAVPSVPSMDTSIYGVGRCRSWNEGIFENCYYLSGSAKQEYRQTGIYKLSAGEMEHIEAYLSKEKQVRTVDTYTLFEEKPSFPDISDEDLIALYMGPEKEELYKVQPGDSFWSLSERFYGEGGNYPYLLAANQRKETQWLHVGEFIRIPRLDFYLVHKPDEEGSSYYYWALPNKEPIPTIFLAAKPSGWFSGSTEADAGLSALWPKEGTGKIRILYCIDRNEQGDLFAQDWEGVKKRLKKSASQYGKEAIEGLRFYHYQLENGEYLYGYEFLVYRSDGVMKAAVFYRMRENLLVEYIGLAPQEEALGLTDQVRYLAARIRPLGEVYEQSCSPNKYGGRENWDFPTLHNPFSIALTYNWKEKNSIYMLWSGAQ